MTIMAKRNLSLEARFIWFAISMFMMVIVSGCSSGPAVIPEELESHIDQSISFQQIHAAPTSYSGRTVLLGGEILSAKRTSNGTQFEVLQLPVRKDDPPAEQRTESQGRFLAIHRGEIDPAAMPPGTRITLVGEVTGETTQQLDDSEYRYPTIEVKHVHVWKPDVYEHRRSSSPRVGFGIGVGGGGGRSGGFGGVGIGTGF
jgi:outer membrane lipoprotein